MAVYSGSRSSIISLPIFLGICFLMALLNSGDSAQCDSKTSGWPIAKYGYGYCADRSNKDIDPSNNKCCRSDGLFERCCSKYTFPNCKGTGKKVCPAIPVTCHYNGPPYTSCGSDIKLSKTGYRSDSVQGCCIVDNEDVYMKYCCSIEESQGSETVCPSGTFICDSDETG